MAREQIKITVTPYMTSGGDPVEITITATVAKAQHDQGKFPTVRYDEFGGFTASLVASSRWAQTIRTEWTLTFKSDGIYKSLPCRRAEAAGVRYASHRKGYRASLRAMLAFAADWDVFMADRGEQSK